MIIEYLYIVCKVSGNTILHFVNVISGTQRPVMEIWPASPQNRTIRTKALLSGYLDLDGIFYVLRPRLVVDLSPNKTVLSLMIGDDFEVARTDHACRDHRFDHPDDNVSIDVIDALRHASRRTPIVERCQSLIFFAGCSMWCSESKKRLLICSNLLAFRLRTSLTSNFLCTTPHSNTVSTSF